MEQNNTQKKFNWKQELSTLLIIFVMVAIQCIAINGLYKPNSLVSGGFTGISLLGEYALGLPSWITLFILNVPVLILALVKLHLRFTIYTIGTPR